VKLNNKTALGVDITEERVSLVLLKKKGTGLELAKSASGPVPKGAIKGGMIQDPVLLSKAIRQVTSHGRIWVRFRQAAVSLTVEPTIVQIMNMPKKFPTTLGQFVQSELKHCVALSGKKTAMDYCGLGSATEPGSRRLLAVATDGTAVSRLVRACTSAGISVEAIEPPLLAYARALYAKKIARRFDCNVLVAILQSSVLTLCVFRKQTVDFVRTKYMGQEATAPERVCEWLSNQINAVIQFYDIEVPDSPGKWEVTVVTDAKQTLPKNAEETLKAAVGCPNLDIRTPANIRQDAAVEQKGVSGAENASMVAIGLAMKLLTKDGADLKINLLPPEATEVKSFKKHAVITANIMAAIVSASVLGMAALGLMIDEVKANILRTKQRNPLHDMSKLIRENSQINTQIEQLSGGPDQLNEILNSRRDLDWTGLLDDLRKNTPKSIRIVSLRSQGEAAVTIEGLALSYQSVHLFVSMLNRCEHIKSASLIETEKDEQYSGLVTYTISCALMSNKGR
jgi:Tfp pilus assembly PilM family ATPase/Tfp pilus assembly protein PilN